MLHEVSIIQILIAKGKPASLYTQEEYISMQFETQESPHGVAYNDYKSKKSVL